MVCPRSERAMLLALLSLNLVPSPVEPIFGHQLTAQHGLVMHCDSSHNGPIK